MSDANDPTDGQVRSISRREALARCAGGFGTLAFGALMQSSAAAARPGRPRSIGGGLHHRARAKHVIFLFMDGGPSQVDTFDPKPRLTRDSGKPFPMKTEPTQFNNIGNSLGSPWPFQKHGESGIEVSSLFPHVARCVDRLAVIRSMTADFPEHTNANYFMHTGHGLQGRPSMGAWSAYGLGSDNQDLPGYVVLNGGLIPPGGLDNFGAGFLSARHQASLFAAGDPPVANIRPAEPAAALQRRKLDLIRKLDQQLLERDGRADAVESAIRNYELAARMQLAVPELYDLDQETEVTKRLYGLDAPYDKTRNYGRQCLLARRLVERGVRFIELTCPPVGADRWDQHSRLKQGHENNARAVDQPIAALLLDLEARGLLEDTLVVWTGEFGRTPFAQGRDGRDHNPYGFSTWLAGGGIRGGVIHGATDEYGYKAVEDKVTVHDLHATILHLLGVDHERLTFRFGGRDMRLTDVYGNVVRPILA